MADQNFDLNKYFDLLKIKSYKIIGSYVNPNREFYSDVDLEEVLDDITISDFIRKLQSIIREIKKRKDIFFLDFKAGNRNGQPIKWSQQEILAGYRYIDDKKISLAGALQDKAIVKLDVLLLTDDFLIPVTINYWLYDKDVNKETFKGDLYHYAMYLKEKGEVIEYIKKMLLYNTLIKNTEKEARLTKLLNSKFGLTYKYVGLLESILLLLKSSNMGYHVDTIRNNFKKIYKELPKDIRHLILPLIHISNKQMLIDTIPKVIHGLEEYIQANVKIDQI